jgi:hypothetical protein
MKHADAKQDKPAMKQVARQAVKQHEEKMHAKGGMVARGGGAARKSSVKFVRNG